MSTSYDLPKVPSTKEQPIKSTRSNPDNVVATRKKWDDEYGQKLFDVLNKQRVAELVKDRGAFNKP